MWFPSPPYSHRLGNMRRSQLRFNSATTFQPWKQPSRLLVRFACWSLQFGHDLSAVETTGTVSATTPVNQLQFGHDLSAMETPLKHFNLLRVCVASIRPRPFSRGNFAPCGPKRITLWNFNSATTFQPWKQSGRLAAVLPHRRFNSATTFQPWKLLNSSYSVRWYGRFNSATTFQPWKRWRTEHRGRFPRRFNSATTFQPWKLQFLSYTKELQNCFNSATTFQPWKLHT